MPEDTNYQSVARKLDDLDAKFRAAVSAILLGGGVTVGKDSDVGGDFKKVPACRKADQTGCVVAFSSWSSTCSGSLSCLAIIS